MKRLLRLAVLTTTLFLVVGAQADTAARTKGILLEDLTWMEAEKALTSNTVIATPLGAEAKEHGPHLKLKNDWLMAEYLKTRVLERADVVVAPTINYSFIRLLLSIPVRLLSDLRRHVT